MSTEAEKRAKLKYDKANVVQFNIKLNKNTNADLIELIYKQENKQRFFKKLLERELYTS